MTLPIHATCSKCYTVYPHGLPEGAGIDWVCPACVKAQRTLTLASSDPNACNCLGNDSACWSCSKGSHQDCTAELHKKGRTTCPAPSVTVTKNPSGKWEASAVLGTHRGWALQKTEEEARSKALLRLQSSLEGWFEPIRKE